MLIAWLTLAYAADLPPCTAPGEKTAFLLTMTPGPSLPTAFGHTGLLLYDPALGQKSPVYDHGHYNSRDPWFPAKYLMGTARYWGLKRPMTYVKRLYANWHRDIIAQRLALTPAEFEELLADQDGRVGDENAFTYAWYTNNCTTRVRDGIDVAMAGELRESMRHPAQYTAREGLLRHAQDSPLGHAFSYGGGAGSDTPLDGWQASYIPADFLDELAKVKRTDGTPLVAQTCRLVGAGGTFPPRSQPDRTASYGSVGGVAAAVVAAGAALPGFGRILAGVFGLLVAGLAAADLLFLITDAGTPWWTHHNQVIANPLALSLTLWGLNLRRARPFALLTVAIACSATLVWLAMGLPHHNLSAILLVVPGLVASAAVLERWHRITEPSTPET